MSIEGQQAGYAGGRGQGCAQPGAERGCGEGARAAHSPAVTEGRVLGLEVRGLQEDIQGFLEVTQLVQALALRRRALSILLQLWGLHSWQEDRERAGQRLQETRMERDAELSRDSGTVGGSSGDHSEAK